MKRRNPNIRTLSRSKMVARACNGRRRVGRRLAYRASETFGRFGYVHALPAFGPAHEKLAMVPLRHPLGPFVQSVRRQQNVFTAKDLARALGRRVDSREGLAALARAGLAVSAANNGLVELAAADPRAAAIINARRWGPSRSGTSIKKVVEAFAPGAPVKRVGAVRVVDAGIAMARWGIDSADVLDRPRRVHLKSSWQFPRSTRCR